MACSKMTNKLERLLECGVCKDIFQKPMRLACFHAFCKTCIKKQPGKKENEENGILCPVCKSFCKKSEMKSSVLVNELLDAYIMSQDGEQKCQQCSTKKSKWHCLECKMDFCENCKLNHLKIPLLRNHRFADRNKTDDITIDSLVFCETHPDEPIKFNCKTCDTLICIMCKVTKHESHQTEAIQENLDRILSDVTKNAEKLETKVTNLEEYHKAIVAKEQEVKEDYSKCRDEARNNLNDVIEKAKEQHKKVVKQLDDQEEEELAKLKAGKLEIENKQKEYGHLSKWISTSVEMAKGVTLVAEIQGDLFNRVADRAKSRGKKSIFVEAPKLEVNISEEGMKAMIGIIKYKSIRVKKSNVVRLGSGRTPPIPFTDLFKKQFKHCYDINLPSRATRMDTINGDIWVPLPKHQFIQVYDIHGDELERLQLNGSVAYAVKQAKNGDIIVASNTGLHTIDETGHILSTIAQGSFSDFEVVEDKIAAIYFNSTHVYIYQFLDGTWTHQKAINSATGLNYTAEDTISLVNDSINSICRANSICHYNATSYNFIQQYSLVHGYRNPFICGSDKEGNIIVSYTSNNVLYLLTSNGAWEPINNPGFSYMCDAISCDEGVIWVLHQNGTMLSQYEYQ